ncbi:DUF3291 domain-containing protein [Fibrisoma montanum]|uniref:DUF3291 domain-containing protein n=1 Tax=Fibrisoma montanum TaxID=2305895 RepID=A0A418LYZ3_9BACT|nr:DUF3291 domain-containing protein [Fibrisoma montanum]RIV18442.1 DUF3291 domain-containing protein [Fibrisoma montanum]
MPTQTHHLAQMNISRMLAPTIDHPIMAEFVAQLSGINTLAEQSDGFIWRLTGEGNNATDLRPYDDERIIVNLSVWESVEKLQQFVFRTLHTEVMKDRRKWFEKPDQQTTVLWWVPAGHTPTIAEAKERLTLLNTSGPGPLAFTFRDSQPAPDSQISVINELM